MCARNASMYACIHAFNPFGFSYQLQHGLYFSYFDNCSKLKCWWLFYVFILYTHCLCTMWQQLGKWVVVVIVPLGPYWIINKLRTPIVMSHERKYHYVGASRIHTPSSIPTASMVGLAYYYTLVHLLGSTVKYFTHTHIYPCLLFCTQKTHVCMQVWQYSTFFLYDGSHTCVEKGALLFRILIFSHVRKRGYVLRWQWAYTVAHTNRAYILEYLHCTRHNDTTMI